jgi:hypothetical protein
MPMIKRSKSKLLASTGSTDELSMQSYCTTGSTDGLSLHSLNTTGSTDAPLDSSILTTSLSSYNSLVPSSSLLLPTTVASKFQNSTVDELNLKILNCFVFKSSVTELSDSPLPTSHN